MLKIHKRIPIRGETSKIMRYFLTILSLLYFSNYCYGQYFEISNTTAQWSAFGFTNTQSGEPINLCIIDYNKTSNCINDTKTPSNDNSTFFEKEITPLLSFSRASFGFSKSFIGGKNKPGFLKGRLGLSLGIATLSGKQNDTRIDGTGTVWGGEVQLQENRLELLQLYPILGFRPIFKYFHFGSHFFPVLITGSNQASKYFERTHAKVSGSSSSVGGTYTFKISKKQSVHIDFLREQLKAKLIIHDNDFDINNKTSSFAVKFDLSL